MNKKKNGYESITITPPVFTFTIGMSMLEKIRKYQTKHYDLNNLNSKDFQEIVEIMQKNGE